jgi:hypothetical protein
VLPSISKVRLAAPGPFHLRAGATVSGEVTLLGDPGITPSDVYFVLSYGLSGLHLDPATGDFSFKPELPGDFIAEVEAFSRVTETCSTVLATTTLVFHVSPAQRVAPVPVGWQPLEVAAGERATFQLQAYDPEGGAVAYSLSSKGGLDASVDPATGLLKLAPKSTDAGSHTLQVTLSDGNASATYPLEVHVDEPSHVGAGYGPYLVMGAVVLLVAAVVWGGRRRAAGRPKP